MRKLPLLLAAAAMAYMPSAFAAGKYNFQKVDGVVELFTSQGCSSCPPADAYMGDIRRGNKNKLALTYAVTIWDYLGWKDKFATVKNTNRQRSYSRYMRLGNVYTPQSVVNGATDAIGSDRSKVGKHLKKSHLTNKNVYVPMKIAQDGKKVTISLPTASSELLASRKNFDATLWLVKYKDVAKVSIAAGENAGRAIEYHNVVGDFTSLGMWEGKPQSFTIAHRDLSGMVGNLKTNKFALLLQIDGVGPIISAVKIN